jgi:hypothetical protein
LASQINASNSGFGGIVSTGDSSGVLQLQTAGATAVTIDTSQRAAFVAGTAALPAITTTGDTNTGMFFPAADTIAFAEGGAEAMRLDSAGNVGIGTTSPNYKLTFGGQTGATATPLALRFSNDFSNGTTAASSKIFLYNDGSSPGGIFGFGVGSNADIQYHAGSTGASNGNHRWYTNDTERMRIGSDGFVRVNNTGGLDGQFSSLAGAFYAAAFANTDATITTVYSWNKATSGNNLFYQFYTDTGTLRGSIDYNRGAGLVRYNTSSDVRLKENIVDAPPAIDLINSVKIRSFDWKETGFHVDYGVIAQELNEVVPDAVSEGIDNEDGTIKQSWGVDTSVLVPAMIKAIQEQQTIINDLKARVEALEAK